MQKGGKTLKLGTNCIAIHCHQTAGGPCIDAGLASVTEQAKKQAVIFLTKQRDGYENRQAVRKGPWRLLIQGKKARLSNLDKDLAGVKLRA